MEEQSSCEPLPILRQETVDTEHLLIVDGLHYAIDGKSILKDISFEIKGAGITSVLGANGSGKSTMLRLIAGFLEPTQGRIYFEGEQVLGPNQKLVAGHESIALVRQDNRLFPLHTVKENLRHILRDEFEDVKEAKIEQLSELLGLKANLGRILKFLSGGEQQRVAIAAALASNPKLMLMDEPFSQTDMYLKQELKGYLTQVVEQLKIHILFVSHDPQDALALSDEIIIISNGELLEKGSPQTLYYSPKSRISATLTGYCNWLPDSYLKEDKKKWHKIGEQYLIRTDQIQINLTANPNTLPAKILKVEFCGFYQNVVFELKDILGEWHATQSTQIQFEINQPIWVDF